MAHISQGQVKELIQSVIAFAASASQAESEDVEASTTSLIIRVCRDGSQTLKVSRSETRTYSDAWQIPPTDA